MKKIIKKPEDIFKFPTINNENGYCQWLPYVTKYFLISAADELTIEKIILLPEAFSVVTCNDTPNKYGWEKIGNAKYNE
jgi:hypothetical protein